MERFVRAADDTTEPAPPQSEIARWEAETGTTLPDDYKAFIKKYNGGFVFPEFFPSNYPKDHEYYEEFDEDDRVEFLYNWSDFTEENAFKVLWNDAEFAAFAEATSGHLLLRIAEPSFGSVHLWSRNNDAWDEPGETVVTGTVAPSFRAFIENVLHEGIGPSSRWDHPSFFKDAQKIDF